jgi:hypothetical protein
MTVGESYNAGYEQGRADAKIATDDAYGQRNVLVAALARIFPSGIRPTAIEGWSDDWHGCVYVDLPTGQISYHYHDSERALFADLPPYAKPWDGHDKDAVHARLLSIEPAKSVGYASVSVPTRTDDPQDS